MYLSAFWLPAVASASAVLPRYFNSTTSALVTPCGPPGANIVCLNGYGSLLAPTYERDPSAFSAYTNTSDPRDPSWSLVQNASFVVFDQDRGLELLGNAPKLEKVFDVLSVIHEGPVYLPTQNKLYINQIGPPGNISQLVVDLNQEPPVLSSIVTQPPVYQPNGGTLRNGSIYWTAMGSNDSSNGGVQQRPGLARIDPDTGKSEIILNSFYGFEFSGPNDLIIDDIGDIWFTDSDYGYGLFLNPNPPATQLVTYRFRPSTGYVTVVEDTLQRPNGIAFSPDYSTLYITDSGLESAAPLSSATTDGFYAYPIAIQFNATAKRNVYAYDVNRPNDVNGDPYISNKRVIWQSLEGAPDGLKVARNGYLVVAAGLASGVDILDPYGHQLARIQTNHPVENIAWVGDNFQDLWLTGIGGISRVSGWNLLGPIVS